MSTDNRTMINDCEAVTGWTGDDAVTVVNDVGAFYEGSNSLSWQASNAAEQMSTTQDSVGAGTFSLDWSDSTLYMVIKDNLGNTYANGGVEFVIGDGTDLTGYDVGGNDAGGVLLPTYFQCYKLDVSQAVTTPGGFTDHAGTEANLDHTAITVIGYGSLHLDKANGPSDNVFMDAFRYIANGSYALTINGGTVGTPETMSDVSGDDSTNGWGMVGNPIGAQYWFAAPTEWGDSGTANTYFTASNEQWFWVGDNGGGRPLGAGNFPFRVFGNGTGTNSFVIDGVVVVNTGTGADLDVSDANIDIGEANLCSFSGLASFAGPSSGGTSRFWTNCSFIGCGTVTHNGADMSGCSYLESTVAADTGALVYNETANPSATTTGSTFTKGANAHHAFEFGTSAPQTMTLTDCSVSGFHASNQNNDSALLFPDTGSDVTWTVSIVNGTGTFSYKQLRGTPGGGAGSDTVTVTASVTLAVTAKFKGAAVEGARVRIETTGGTLIANGTTNASGVYSVGYNYTGDTAVNVIVRLKGFKFFESVDLITGSGLNAAAPLDADPTVSLP